MVRYGAGCKLLGSSSIASASLSKSSQVLAVFPLRSQSTALRPADETATRKLETIWRHQGSRFPPTIAFIMNSKKL